MTGLALPRSDEIIGKAIAGFRLHGGYYCIRLLRAFDAEAVHHCANELMSLILQQAGGGTDAMRAGAQLKIKIMNLGGDMMPSYREHMYGKFFDHGHDPAHLKPGFIVEILLNDLGVGFKDLSPFLLMLPDEVLINCSDPTRACSLVVKMSGRESLLPYASKRVKGQHLDDALGL
jgi:hypothetical protein